MSVESISCDANALGMNVADPERAPASLVVFSDDWGRHPSSCQHLIKQLLPKYKVLWVNTIGTRAPRFDLATMRRVAEKVKQWIGQSKRSGSRETSKACLEEALTSHELGCGENDNLTVANPKMWPWFSRSIDRRFNHWLLTRQLTPLIEALPQPVSAITTLPITADLPGQLPVSHWLYYCVDDFGAWPGLDGNTLRRMDEQMIKRADSIVAVSEHLRNMISGCGRDSSLLTHGVDLQHWNGEGTQCAALRPGRALPARSSRPSRTEGDVKAPHMNSPVAVFWGVVDRRLDTAMLTALSQRMTDGQIVLIGPHQDPDPAVLNLPNVTTTGPKSFNELPQMAQAADVLIMPYADLPVTRAMQPLKMKEYIATGRPVVVSDLPAVRQWRDCMDVTSTPDQFADAVLQRVRDGVPHGQLEARQRLKVESWTVKANELEKHFA